MLARPQLEPFDGEVWTACRDGVISSYGRFVNASGAVAIERRREMLTAFDRRPEPGERATRVAPGEDIRSFAWSEDVKMARALAVTERLVKGVTVENAHRRARSAHDLLAWARERFGRRGKGVSFREGTVRLRGILAEEIAKVRKRRIALAGMAYTWSDISRMAS